MRPSPTRLAAEGVRLALMSRRAEGLDHKVDQLRSVGAEAVAVPGDVADAAATDALVARAVEQFGRIDIVVNNAGSDSGHLPIDRLADADWEASYRLNVVSAMRLTVAALPFMRERRWGRVVNVSSYTARVPEPFCAPYAAAKAALVNATRNLSRSFRPDGICANCILPGLIDTEGTRAGFEEAMAATGRPYDQLLSKMLERAPIDAGRLGTSEEVAAVVAFLCSEQAAWLTGAAINIDGGTIRSAF